MGSFLDWWSDISVPSHLRAKFSEMTPIFKNVKVGREHLGDRMLCLARQRGYLSTPSRMLVGALKGERILLFSELARWYLQHGLVITRIYQLLQYKRGKPFQSFGESVSATRREEDSDPAKSVIAENLARRCDGTEISHSTSPKNRPLRMLLTAVANEGVVGCCT